MPSAYLSCVYIYMCVCRVARVVQDSPCDRQGAADVGDVIVSVNHVELGPLLETEAARLLHGPAGGCVLV